MGLVEGVLSAIAAVATSALAKIAADEVKEWSPQMSSWLIERALLHLPDVLRDHCREEWAAGVWEIPGTVGKLLYAAGLPLAARRKRIDHEQQVSAWLVDLLSSVQFISREIDAIVQQQSSVPLSSRVRECVAVHLKSGLCDVIERRPCGLSDEWSKIANREKYQAMLQILNNCHIDVANAKRSLTAALQRDTTQLRSLSLRLEVFEKP